MTSSFLPLIISWDEKSSMIKKNKMLRFSFSLLVGCVCLLMSAFSASAQGNKTMPIPDEFNLDLLNEFDEEDSAEKREKAALSKKINDTHKQYKDNAFESLKGKIDYRSNQAAFDKWFKSYIIPMMTIDDPQELRKIAEKRIEFFDDYVIAPSMQNQGNPALKRAAIEHLVRDIAFPMFSDIVTNNEPVSYAKQVKINAMLAIGELNLSEGKHASSLPVPLPEALPFMLSAIKSDKVEDYLKATALSGIERHALLDAQKPVMNPANQAEVKAVCLALLGDKPADRSDDLHYWMQRKATRILGAYGDPAADKSIANAIAKIIADKEARMWLRCEAAKAYGNLKFASAADANAKNAGTEIGKVALTALRKEARYLRGQIIFLAEMEIKRKETKTSVVSIGGSDGGGDDREMMETAMMEAMMTEQSTTEEDSSEEMMMMQFGSEFGRDDGEEKKDPPKVSEFGHKADPEKELPGYKLDIARRRLKTVAMYLDSAIGPSNNAAGISKYLAAGDGKPVLDSLRAGLADIEHTSHMGVDDSYEALTLDMIDTLLARAEKLANSLGVVEEVSEEDAALDESTKKAEEALDAGEEKKAAAAAAGANLDDPFSPKAAPAAKEAPAPVEGPEAVLPE